MRTCGFESKQLLGNNVVHRLMPVNNISLPIFLKKLYSHFEVVKMKKRKGNGGNIYIYIYTACQDLLATIF